MIKITDKKDCCGCTACAGICAHHAITMVPDALGFLYPKVDESKCVECGLCERICQFNDKYATSLNNKEPLAYAARHSNMDEVMASRSGAAFVAISDYVLEQGGVVYGVGYKDHFRVAHKRATTKVERDEFRGSKYVQSDLTGIFHQVKNDLKHDITVLFSGTPCQTSGLNAFVGEKLRSRLILVDIVCHGVASPCLWRDYLAYLEKKEGDHIQTVNFRDKEKYGWSAHIETFIFAKNANLKRVFPYRFYQTVSFRQSCSNCHFSNTTRPSDVTLGDLWGWQKLCPELNNDNKGVNLILLNTEKGIKLFEEVNSRLRVFPLPSKSYLQPNLIAPTKLHRQRNQFVKDYTEKGFEYIIRHQYHADSLLRRIIKKCNRMLKASKY